MAVAIVVDQLAQWLAEDRFPDLPAGGGFRRLLDEGDWGVIDFGHATTDTAPGHAALFTGRSPSTTGIVANEVLRHDLGGKITSLIEDDRERLLARDGRLKDAGGKERNGVSLRFLEADTLGDRLMACDSRAHIISLSLKDRGAVFAAPREDRRRQPDPERRPAQVVWQDESTGELVTSTAFLDQLPKWARRKKAAELLTWNRADWGGTGLARDAGPDEQEGEDGSMTGERGGAAFPHAFRGDEYKKFRASPFGDELLVDLALAALDDTCRGHAEGKRCRLGNPLLLAISFSSHDYGGHRFGPDSWEARDLLFRLDGQLARLLGALDERFGPAGYSVILSADHGIVPLSELTERTSARWCVGDPGGGRFQMPCARGRRLFATTMNGALHEALTAISDERPVEAPARIVEPLVFLDRRGRSAGWSVAAAAVVSNELSTFAGVAKVYDLDAVCQSAPPSHPVVSIDGLVRNSTLCRNGRSVWGQYAMVPERGSFFTQAPYMVGHGSPYPYDRLVPLLVRPAKGARARKPAAGVRPNAPGPPRAPDAFYRSVWAALERAGGRP